MFNNVSRILSSYLVKVKDDFVNSTKDKKGLLLILIMILIFLTLAIFIYNTFIKSFINKKHPLNKEFISTSDSDDVLIIYFYTQWCPYCKQSLPEITKFEEYIVGLNGQNSYKITVTKIDCDENPTIAEKYNIQGYPTIKLIYKGKVYDYDAKPNRKNLIEFLETSIA